jgi:hypothetical protein
MDYVGFGLSGPAVIAGEVTTIETTKPIKRLRQS